MMNNNQLNQVKNPKKKGIIMALMLVICVALVQELNFTSTQTASKREQEPRKIRLTS